MNNLTLFGLGNKHFLYPFDFVASFNTLNIVEYARQPIPTLSHACRISLSSIEEEISFIISFPILVLMMRLFLSFKVLKMTFSVINSHGSCCDQLIFLFFIGCPFPIIHLIHIEQEKYLVNNMIKYMRYRI